MVVTMKENICDRCLNDIAICHPDRIEFDSVNNVVEKCSSFDERKLKDLHLYSNTYVVNEH